MNTKQPQASEMKDDTHPRWLTVQQLMKRLPLKRSRIYYLTHVGAIPHHKIGQTLLFCEDEIIKWMEGNKARNESPSDSSW